MQRKRDDAIFNSGGHMADKIEAKAPVVSTTLTPLRGSTRRKPLYVPVKNEKGNLLWINKSQLYIDTQYQRPLTPKLVGRIMANWSWVSCGTLLVSKRPSSGKFFILDGQHRWEAACQLPLIRDLPCLLFELDTVQDEAIGFLASNTERKIPTLANQFKALLTTGDSAAKALYELANEAERDVGAPSDGDHVSCVSDCMYLIREDESIFRRIFPIAADLCRGHAMTGRLLKGLHYLERHMPGGVSLQDTYWHRRILRIGYEEIQFQIKQAALYHNRGDAHTCADGILRAINRHLRQPLEMTNPT
jgi:hypothetical protein